MRVRQIGFLNRPAEDHRRGAATVEFAIVVPLFLSLVLGIVEMSRALDVSTNLTSAIREGGRLVSMDYTDSIPTGMTTNQKVIQDIRNMLKAAGIPEDKVTISITHADGASAGQDFDFDDPANKLQNFKIAASVPYADVSLFPAKIMTNQNVSAILVMRMGRGSVAE